MGLDKAGSAVARATSVLATNQPTTLRLSMGELSRIPGASITQAGAWFQSSAQKLHLSAVPPSLIKIDAALASGAVAGPACANGYDGLRRMGAHRCLSFRCRSLLHRPVREAVRVGPERNVKGTRE